MILYHGSNSEIDHIDLTKSKRYKDFGRAFYLSAEKEQAQKMADAKTIQFGGTAVVTAFEYDETSCADLSVMMFPHYSREWAEFVYNNRDEQQDFQHDFDIVYGPIANDYIGLQIRDYRRHRLTFEQFMENKEKLSSTHSAQRLPSPNSKEYDSHERGIPIYGGDDGL